MSISPYTIARTRDVAAVAMSPIPHDMRRSMILRADRKQSKLYENMRQYDLGELPGLTVSLTGFDRRKCIFVHIPKCAGTSVGKSLFGNYAGNHMGITTYEVIFTKREFESYFKFSFVRNPWDRVFSAYRYTVNGDVLAAGAPASTEEDKQLLRSEAEVEAKKLELFDRFVVEWLNPERIRLHEHFRPQHRFVCSANGQLQLDYVGRFETIEEDMVKIWDRLGLDATLNHANKTAGGTLDYRDYYTPELRRKVADLYRKDIEMFDYTFDG